MRGLKTKVNVVHRILDELNPTIFTLAETKLGKFDKFEVDGYVVKRVDRDSGAGGVLLGFKKALLNLVSIVNEYKKHNCEMLWLKIDNGIEKIRIGAIYMPQESRTLVKELKEIYMEIEKEIRIAEEHGEKLLIMGDLNCKVGNQIKGNKDEISRGGEMLIKICEQHNIKILNGEKCCNGLWTRVQDDEQSVLDYILTRKEDVGLVSSMLIDHDRNVTPYSLEYSANQGFKRTYSDHFTITCSINWKVEGRNKHVKKLNKKKAAAFERELGKENVSLLIDERPIRDSYAEWNAIVLEIRDKFSTRIRTRRKWKLERLLSRERKAVNQKLKLTNEKDQIKELKSQKQILMDMIDEEQRRKEFARISKIVTDVKEAGGVDSTAFWKVRSRILGRQEELGDVMEDDEGVLHEDPKKIKEIHARYYENLLTRTKSETAEGKDTEDMKLIERGMEILAKSTVPQKNRKR